MSLREVGQLVTAATRLCQQTRGRPDVPIDVQHRIDELGTALTATISRMPTERPSPPREERQ